MESYRLGGGQCAPLCLPFTCFPITTKLGTMVLWDIISQKAIKILTTSSPGGKYDMIKPFLVSFQVKIRVPLSFVQWTRNLAHTPSLLRRAPLTVSCWLSHHFEYTGKSAGEKRKEPLPNNLCESEFQRTNRAIRPISEPISETLLLDISP